MSYLETKKGSLEEAIRKHDEDYQAMFKKELDKSGKSIGQMTPDEKKAFFNKLDKMHTAKNEAKVDELTKAQKKLPPGLQKAIKKKEMKEEQIDEVNLTFIRKFADDMKKDKQFKPFADKFMKMAMKGGSPRDALEKSLPDYISGKDIEKLIDKNRMSAIFGEDVRESKQGKVDVLKTKLAKEKDTDALQKQITQLTGQLALAKQKLENEKHGKLQPEPNPETGEVPLTVGIAYKHLRDKMKKEEEKKPIKKTMVGSKADKVDTEPEVEFDR